MCHKVVYEETFLIKYCHDKYKTQEMCDIAFDDFLLALKFVPNWFVTSNMIEKLDFALFSNDDIVFVVI